MIFQEPRKVSIQVMDLTLETGMCCAEHIDILTYFNNFGKVKLVVKNRINQVLKTS